MKWENLSQDERDAIKEELVKYTQRFQDYGIIKLDADVKYYVGGSWVKGNADEFSDVDLFVVTQRANIIEDLEPKKRAELWKKKMYWVFMAQKNPAINRPLHIFFVSDFRFNKMKSIEL